MDEQYEELLQKLREIIPNFSTYSDDPAALEQAIGGEEALEGVDRQSYLQALDQALEEAGVPEDVRGQVADQLEAQDDYSSDGLLQHLTIVINDNDVTNNIDQSLNIEGEVHGDVYQANTSNVANATGEGAIAGEEVYGNQVQTGDGQQVGGNSGVQNQGDNSGQQAGGTAVADNVTTGDGNTIGSGEASQVGAGQVSQDYATIDDSAQAFGEGAATNDSTQTSDSHYSETFEHATEGSYNYEDNDVNTQTQTIDEHGGYGEPEYEPVYDEHDDYKVEEHDDYKVDDDYKADDYHDSGDAVEID